MPLTSAYTTCEAFGWETGVDWNWREAPAFYGLLAFFIGFAALFVMIPGLPLITVMFLAQVLNALLLPFILVFVMLLASDKKLMGPLASGRLLRTVGWVCTALLVLLSLILLVSSLSGVCLGQQSPPVRHLEPVIERSGVASSTVSSMRSPSAVTTRCDPSRVAHVGERTRTQPASGERHSGTCGGLAHIDERVQSHGPVLEP